MARWWQLKEMALPADLSIAAFGPLITLAYKVLFIFGASGNWIRSFTSNNAKKKHSNFKLGWPLVNNSDRFLEGQFSTDPLRFFYFTAKLSGLMYKDGVTNITKFFIPNFLLPKSKIWWLLWITWIFLIIVLTLSCTFLIAWCIIKYRGYAAFCLFCCSELWRRVQSHSIGQQYFIPEPPGATLTVHQAQFANRS